MDSTYSIDGGQTFLTTPYTNYTTHDKGQVKLVWNDVAEKSTDVVTGYADFAGYKIYKSIDGGATWGDDIDKIYNDQGTHVGWKPYAQFHYTADQDSTHCIYTGGFDGQSLGFDCRGVDFNSELCEQANGSVSYTHLTLPTTPYV